MILRAVTVTTLVFVAVTPVCGARAIAPTQSTVSAGQGAACEAGCFDCSPDSAGAWTSALTPEAAAAVRAFLARPGRVEQANAVRLIERTMDRTPDPARAHAAIGMIYARGPDLTVPDADGYLVRRVQMATNAESRARREFLLAIDLDPTLIEPALELTRLALATRAPATLRAAQSVIDTVSRHVPSDIRIWTTKADIEAALGNATAAEQSARMAIAEGDCAPPWQALAMALALENRDEEAGAAYRHALDAAVTDFDWTRLYDDVKALLDPDELADARDVTKAFRFIWLRNWWERAAARSGRTFAERTAGNLRRIDHAQRRFRRMSSRGARPASIAFGVAPAVDAADQPAVPGGDPGSFQALWLNPTLADLPFDERGLIWIRHGEPDRVLITGGETSRKLPNETWIYWRSDGNWLFNFVKARDWPDWLLSNGPLCMGDYNLDRVAYDTHYQRLFTLCRGPDRVAAVLVHRELAADLQAMASVALRTEGEPHHFDRSLPTITATYAFRGDRMQTDLAAITWLPLERLKRDATGAVAVRLSVIATAQGEGRVERVDTVLATGPAAGAGSSAASLRALVMLEPAPTDSATIRFVVSDANNASLGADRGQERAIPAFGGTGPDASDLVIAYPGTDGPLRRGDIALSPVPDHAIRVGESVRLYYELYAMPPDESYTTTLRVERADREGLARLLDLFPGRSERQDLRFGGIAPDSGDVIREDRQIGGSLLPGTYDLTVEITTSTGATIVRSARLRINEG